MKGWKSDSHRHMLAAKGIRTVRNVDLKKYSGEWRQVSVKNEPWFQKGDTDVRAKYTLQKDGTVKVVNTAKNSEGKRVRIEGTAESISKNNKDLLVNFGLFRQGKYHIKNVNSSYTRATVTSGDTEWRLER
jgi:apolipoprotein D and lipocalin family protein